MEVLDRLVKAAGIFDIMALVEESSETFETFLIQCHASRFKEKRSRFVNEMNAWIHENLRQVEDLSGCRTE